MRDDLEWFFAERRDLAMEDRIELDYRFECTGDPREAAALLCREQSTAQWQRPGVDEDMRPVHAARVIAFESSRRATGFSITIAGAPSGDVHEVRVTVAHPWLNFGPRVPNLLSAVLGEGVFHVPNVPIIRLEDIRFPASFLSLCDGPKFGLPRIRADLDVHGRPLLIGVVKPNLGLEPQAMADLAYAGWMAGLDYCKDDEMLTDGGWSPTEERARHVGAARLRAEKDAGTPKGYIVNITDADDVMTDIADVATSGGATAVLLNALATGVAAIGMVSRFSAVPIFVHAFPLWALMTRVPGFGVHPHVLMRLLRIAGADAVIFPAGGGRMMTSEADALACISACLAPMGDLLPMLPVPGGADVHSEEFRRTAGNDWGFVAGRAFFGHPGGIAAGVAAVRDDLRRSYPSIP